MKNRTHEKLTKLAHSSSEWELVYACVGALSNIATHSFSQEPLIEAGVLSLLRDLLERFSGVENIMSVSCAALWSLSSSGK